MTIDKDKPIYTERRPVIKTRNNEYESIITTKTVSINQDNWQEAEKVHDEIFGEYEKLTDEGKVFRRVEQLEIVARISARDNGFSNWCEIIKSEDGNSSWMAGTKNELDTPEHYAFHLELACRYLREKLEKGELYQCMLALISAEDFHNKIWIKALERNFFKGRALTHEADLSKQDRALKKWKATRDDFNNDAECDRAIGEEFDRAQSTIRKWRMLNI